jgi:hypothetical protein
MTTEKKEPKSVAYGIGCDIGTMNLISARRTIKGVETKRMRDVFIDFPLNAKKTLRMSNVNFVERGDEILILGDAALEMANVFGKEARRPLSGGLVSPSEIDSLEVLGLLLENILGKPVVENEVCCFSVPANPIDQPGKDIIYHTGVFERIVRECGYRPIPSNEAMAIIFAETAPENFSGIGISAGAGMVNTALAINTIEGLSFSTTRAGDYIDRGAANAVGSTQARICAIKEGGMDLNATVGREQEAIAFYYKAMIEYSLDHIALKFKEIQNHFSLPKPIPIVVSGGSSLVGGFLEFFTQVFEKKRAKFPVAISDIRQAKDPMNAVAYGLLVQAIQEQEDVN